MEHHTAVVVGLGTAGLAACRTLERRGVDYVGLDAKKEIGKPVRSTGGVAYQFIRRYDMPASKDVIAASIRSVKIVSEKGESVRLEYDHDVGVIYDFTKYEQSIVKDKSNLRLGSHVSLITKSDRNLPTVVMDNGEKIEADYLIIATGPVSNIKEGDRDYLLTDDETIAAYEETRIVRGKQDTDVVLYFNSTIAPGGYIWNFADRGNFRRVGLGAVKSYRTDLRKGLATFTADHPEIAGECDHTIAHLIALAKPPRRVVFGRTLIVGEAARTTFADTGGGLQMAFASGMRAGMAVSMGDPLLYQHLWITEIRPLLLRHYKLKEFLYSLRPDEMEKIVRILRQFRPNSEDAYKELPRAVRYVAFRMPMLIPRGIKIFL